MLLLLCLGHEEEEATRDGNVPRQELRVPQDVVADRLKEDHRGEHRDSDDYLNGNKRMNTKLIEPIDSSNRQQTENLQAI